MQTQGSCEHLHLWKASDQQESASSLISSIRPARKRRVQRSLYKWIRNIKDLLQSSSLCCNFLPPTSQCVSLLDFEFFCKLFFSIHLTLRSATMTVSTIIKRNLARVEFTRGQARKQKRSTLLLRRIHQQHSENKRIKNDSAHQTH